MLANGLAGMLIIQVILGGASVIFNDSKTPHVVWGVISFVVLLALVFLIVREFGTKSAPFRISLAALVDFIVQGILGFISFSSNYALIVHLTNAFILMAIVTMMISVLVRTPPKVKATSSAAPM